MIDLHIPVLAFILGFLAGQFSKSWYAGRLWWRLKGAMPRRCQDCGRWLRNKTVNHFVQHRIAGWIYICNDCYVHHFHPEIDPS